MPRWRPQWQPQMYSIQTKLTITFLLILLPLVTISLFSTSYSRKVLDEQISERTRGALLSTLEYVAQLTKNMDQQSLLIASNPIIVDIWRDIEDPLRADHLYDLHMVQQQLSALTNVNGAIKEAFILHGASGNGLSTSKGGIKWPMLNEESWFRQALDVGGGLVLYVPTAANHLQSRYLDDDMIYYVRLLDLHSMPREPNVMILAVEKSELRQLIQPLQATPNTDIQLYFNDTFVLSTNPLSEEVRIQPMFASEAGNGMWTIRLEQLEREVFQLSKNVQHWMYGIVAVSVVLAIWIAWLVYSGIARPLQRLLSAFKQFRNGDWGVQIQHRRKDEFGLVMDGFNQMARGHKQMIEDDYEKELRLAKAEFSMLQSQINPHFLYNTLDSIYSVAVTHKMPQISEMVINLARFFRVSLGKGKEAFTVKETAEHLMYYLRVQQVRMPQIKVEVTLAPETLKLPLIKLMLQPLVENAIVHGLGPSSDEGTLQISTAFALDGRLQIEIRDSGVGMDAEQLAALHQALALFDEPNYRSTLDVPSQRFFGLKNVLARIRMYYGPRAELIIDSEPDVGTVVTVLLPIKEGNV